MIGTESAATPSPSGATAITAAVLSLCGGIVNLLLYGAIVIVSFADDDWSAFTVDLALFVCAGVVASVGLIAGAIMLLRRRSVGRIVVAVSCGVFILMVAASVVLLPLKSDGTDAAQAFTLNSFQLIRGLLLPAVTMILALLPTTARWCMARPIATRPR